MPDNRECIQEWFTKGNRDLVSAKILITGEGPADNIASSLQQAIEKYLKGYLISKGWRLKKTHDLTELMKLAASYNETFNKYLGLAERLTVAYMVQRYPSIAGYSYQQEEIPPLLEQIEDLISLVTSNMEFPKDS